MIKKWDRLLIDISNLQDNSNKLDICNFIRNWIIKNSDFSQHSKRLYWILDIDFNEYLIDKGENASHDIVWLKQLKISTERNMMMILTDYLWEAITLSTSVECPNCGDDNLKFLKAFLKGSDDELILLSCNNCGWEQDSQGNKWEHVCTKVIPGKQESLEIYERKTIEKWNAVKK